MRKSILALTMGDPGGIGPEVILKSLRSLKPSNKHSYVIIGDLRVFSELSGFQKIPVISAATRQEMTRHTISFLDISNEARKILPVSHRNRPLLVKKGKISLINASLAMAALKIATNLAVRRIVDGVVTAPVNKTAMRLINSKFQGHTEYLARKSGTKSFAMMFVHDRLKVTLVTIHVALKKVSALISKNKVYEKIKLTHSFMNQYEKIKNPRIAVCALNPHRHETGKEDDKKILPAVQLARARKMSVVGPLSADQLFHDAYQGRFDAVVSMYHDQGLGPFKMVAFQDGVNVTLGLPFIRTSPDHGTAFDIAGRGKADFRSMKASILLASRLV